MTTLAPFDLHWMVQRLPKQLREAMKKHGPSLVVAGGYVRSCIAREFVTDIDCFCPSADVAKTIAESLLPPGKKLYETDNAYSVPGHKIPLQFIHRWTFATPEAVVPSFDFTIACAAFWWEGDDKSPNGGRWKSLCDDAFYQDLAAKRLVYRLPERNEDPGGSMLRVLKFYQRGYRIDLQSLGNVIARMLSGVPAEKMEQRETCGFLDRRTWERQVGAILTGLLRSVDPLIDPDHIAHESIPAVEGADQPSEAEQF